MKKLLFCVSALALSFSASAQNVWTGTTIPTTTTAGSVGIGTTTPYVPLHVWGSHVGPDNLFNGDDNAVFEGKNALIKLYGEKLGGIDFSTYKTENGVSTFYRNYASFRYNFTTDQLVYQNHKIGQVFMFDTDGNFGVGATPTAKLHVNGSLRFQGNGAGNGHVLTSLDADGNATWKAPDWVRNGSNISYLGGNVGIGTDAPLSKLHLNNGYLLFEKGYGMKWNGSAANIQLSNSDNLAMTIPGATGNGFFIYGIIGSEAKKKFVFQNDGVFKVLKVDEITPSFIVDASGKVGIGQSTPAANLDVNGTVRLSIPGDVQNGYVLTASSINGDAKWQPLTTIAQPWTVSGANIYRASGKVGIGLSDLSTIPAGYMLAVKGKVICEEVKVALYPWADYVFDADYKLPTIDSLEAYIKENKHLPNINSAKEVEAEGLSLGEMQNKQMEKIEELTLYLIQQHKEIEALKNELKAMKQN